MRERVLIVEDDPVLARSVETTLRRAGFDTTVAYDRKSAQASLADQSPDLLVLEPMLPQAAGWELLNALRRDRPDLPVVLLTARAETLPPATGGGPRPPAGLRHATQRLRSALRRTARSADMPGVIAKGGVELDTARHECRVDGHPVFLPPKEFALLAYLMGNAGRVCSRDEILAAVWCRHPAPTRAVDVHIRWLRTLIEKTPSSPQRLLTVRGVGYLFVGE